MKDKIEFIAFDADDTLWESELYIQEFEHKFCNLLRQYLWLWAEEHNAQYD